MGDLSAPTESFDLRDAEALAECPECHATPGQPCVGPTIQPLEKLAHVGRKAAWRARVDAAKVTPGG